MSKIRIYNDAKLEFVCNTIGGLLESSEHKMLLLKFAKTVKNLNKLFIKQIWND